MQSQIINKKINNNIVFPNTPPQLLLEVSCLLEKELWGKQIWTKKNFMDQHFFQSNQTFLNNHFFGFKIFLNGKFWDHNFVLNKYPTYLSA